MTIQIIISICKELIIRSDMTKFETKKSQSNVSNAQKVSCYSSVIYESSN